MPKPPATAPPAAQPTEVSAGPPPSAGLRIRELADELVFVFVLVMFLKLFLVEHYKIPSGSMTPTLRGGMVAYVDVNGDDRKDLVYWDNPARSPLVFVRKNGRYLLDESLKPDFTQVTQWEMMGLVHNEFDHILVNRLAYWFRWPRRGEIVIFKVPPVIYRPEAPIYVKRLVGQPGDNLTFTHEGRLIANGQLVEEPAFFQTQLYRTIIDTPVPGYHRQSDIEYLKLGPIARQIVMIHVGKDEAYVFGDNTNGSLDSRYWGGVPLVNFKGRAFLRIWPLTHFKFLK